MTDPTTRRTVTQDSLAAAFTEWDRRFREDPDAFELAVARILKGVTPETYGESCAPYLIAILDEQFADRFREAQKLSAELMPGDHSTWCVHLIGPDELIPAASRLDAVQAAQNINQFTTDRPEMLDEEGIYPTVWAVPAKRVDVNGHY